MQLPSASPSRLPTLATAPPIVATPSLADLRPVAEIGPIAAKVLEQMGLGEVSVSVDVRAHPDRVDFSVLHFIILPKLSAWLDLMIEIDRASALKIHETFGGSADCSDADLEDVIRETMNLIHGGLKSAFKGIAVDVIIPVVPQSISPLRLSGPHGDFIHKSRHMITGDGFTLRLTLMARVAPVIRKQLKNFRLAEVLVDPIAPGDEGEDQVPIVKKHTMITKRLLHKVQTMAEYEPDDAGTHAIFEPSALAELLPME